MFIENTTSAYECNKGSASGIKRDVADVGVVCLQVPQLSCFP